MTTPQICAVLAAAFAGSLAAYVPTARQRQWPVGQLFERGVVPTAVYLIVAVVLLGVTFGWAWSGKASWWWMLWIVLASFIGAPLITSIFKSWSAMLSLAAAPLLALAAVLMPYPI